MWNLKLRKFILKVFWSIIRKFAPTKISYYTVVYTNLSVLSPRGFQLPTFRAGWCLSAVIFLLGDFNCKPFVLVGAHLLSLNDTACRKSGFIDGTFFAKTLQQWMVLSWVDWVLLCALMSESLFRHKPKVWYSCMASSLSDFQHSYHDILQNHRGHPSPPQKKKKKNKCGFWHMWHMPYSATWGVMRV